MFSGYAFLIKLTVIYSAFRTTSSSAKVAFDQVVLIASIKQLARKFRIDSSLLNPDFELCSFLGWNYALMVRCIGRVDSLSWLFGCAA
jgi:hypothetical protein